MTKEDIIDFEQIYESAYKCRNGVNWKPSTKHFMLNVIEQSLIMERKCKDETWENGKPRSIRITYPKLRDGLSISFMDRVYQRSLNDNALYPIMSKSFIFDNAACQKGKGTDFARRRIKKHIRNFFAKYGLDGYILQIDIKGYYPNMRHDAVNKKFKKQLPDDIFKMVCNVLDSQYAGHVGYNPGSQMVQIAGISILDDLDHFIKEQLHEKYYIRYMDDIWILNHSREKLEQDLSVIKSKLNEIGFEVHPKKTHIEHMKRKFSFLGFDYLITESGKIIMFLNSDNIKHERKKLKKMIAKAKNGEMTKEKIDECYESWKAHASKGNAYKMLQRMDKYYKDLWGDESAKTYKKKNEYSAGKTNGIYEGGNRKTGCAYGLSGCYD